MVVHVLTHFSLTRFPADLRTISPRHALCISRGVSSPSDLVGVCHAFVVMLSHTHDLDRAGFGKRTMLEWALCGQVCSSTGIHPLCRSLQFCWLRHGHRRSASTKHFVRPYLCGADPHRLWCRVRSSGCSTLHACHSYYLTHTYTHTQTQTHKHTRTHAHAHTCVSRYVA